MNTQSLVPQVFSFKEHPMRSVVIKQEPWFVAKDVCDALELQNSRDIVRRHLDDDERTVYEFHTPSRGNVRMTVVNMSGMYALMFRSQKPKAKMFRKWITTEVLPALRDTGTYTTPGKAVREEMAYRAAHQPAPAPKALPSGLPAGVLDARAVPCTTVGFMQGRVRMVVLDGKQWYNLRDVMHSFNLKVSVGRGVYWKASALPKEHKALVWLFAAKSAGWFIDDYCIRLMLGARGMLHSQLTLNLGK